jgi:hypothetical protein
MDVIGEPSVCARIRLMRTRKRGRNASQCVCGSKPAIWGCAVKDNGIGKATYEA